MAWRGGYKRFNTPRHPAAVQGLLSEIPVQYNMGGRRCQWMAAGKLGVEITGGMW